LDAAPGWFAAIGERVKSLGGGAGGGDGGENNSDGGGPEPAAVVTGAAVAAAALRTKSKGEEEEESNRPSAADEDTSPPTDLLGLTRKLIAVRNILRSIDQSDALTLPSIVVVGSQSSGKSTVLEAIVGKEFLPKYVQSTCHYPQIELT
jgi:hypothetical protein